MTIVLAPWSVAYALSIAFRLGRHEQLGLRTWTGAAALFSVWLYFHQWPRLTRRRSDPDPTGQLLCRIAALSLVRATAALDAFHTIRILLNGSPTPVHSALSAINLLIVLRLLWDARPSALDADTGYGESTQVPPAWRP